MSSIQYQYFNAMRSRYIQSLIDQTKVNNEVLGLITRYLFSKEYLIDFENFENDRRERNLSIKESRDEFNDMIMRKIMPSSMLN